MHICSICNFTTTTYNRLKQHNKTKKHLLLLEVQKTNEIEKNNLNTGFICFVCNKEYKYRNNLSRHQKTCKPYEIDNYNSNQQNNDHILMIERLKHDNELSKKELAKLKYDTEINKKEFQKQLKIKELEKELELQKLENKHLQSQIVHNSNSHTNITVNNTVKISKLHYLNTNFSNVIDINTFIDNYKNKYGLTNDQTKILLENYQSDGINACISAMVYYLKKSAARQYKELNGIDIKLENIILPFLLSDKSLREHFEKSVNGKWDKTTMCDNIKRLVTITNDQVYKHHNQFMDINGPQRKRIINGILKSSCYSVLSQISDPNLYKDSEENQDKTIEDGNNILKDKNGDIENDDKDNKNENQNIVNNINSINQLFTEYSEDEYDDDESYGDSDDDIYDCESNDDD
jgi:hypothetical protein